MKPSDYALIPTFVAIVEEKNYTQAAKKLGVSQSAVSQNVNKLRELFDDTLFVRHRHGVEVTKYAQSIYPDLSRALSQISRTLPRYQRFDPVTCDKEFTLSGLSVINNSLLLEVIKYLSVHAPLVRLCVVPLVSEQVSQKLRLQEIDLVLEADLGQHKQLNSQSLFYEQMSVVCRSEHPRLSGQTISDEAFLSEKHIAYAHNPQDENYMTNKGLDVSSVLDKREIALRVNNATDMLNMVKNTDYVAMVPCKSLSASIESHQLNLLQPSFFDEEISVSMFWHPTRNNDPHHRWFRNVCKSIASDMYMH
ncbi:LysR family transcriptional regulator [Photobacterium kasasachensis]|uniref:LysR family transcriptional regulator n=1 Tax=Photobacterium kasasachensis TaxID=2910240 RepID=UPI003D100189